MMRHLLYDYGLFLLLLCGSGFSHWALTHSQPKNVIYVQMYDREQGRTSVAIQLVAARPKFEERIEELIKEVKDPVDTVVQKSLKPHELPIERMEKPPEEIVAAVQPRADAPIVPQLTKPQLEQVEPEKEEPPKEERRKPLPKKMAKLKLPEMESVEFESAVTVVTQQSSGVVEPPQALTNPDPHYPADLVRRNIEGSLQLTVTVAADGSPKTVTIHMSSGHEAMDQAAVDAIRKWKFSPAKRDGQPVEHDVIVPVSFSIKRRR